MAEVGGTIALLVLIGIGVWLFGSLALRVGGLLMFFLGLFGMITRTSGALLVVVLGVVAWLGGHWLYAVKHGVHKSSLAAKVFERRPRHPQAQDRVGELEEPCIETGKMKFADQHAAVEAVQRNQDRFERGLEDRYRLERAYNCEFCNWWHVTSQTKRDV